MEMNNTARKNREPGHKTSIDAHAASVAVFEREYQAGTVNAAASDVVTIDYQWCYNPKASGPSLVTLPLAEVAMDGLYCINGMVVTVSGDADGIWQTWIWNHHVLPGGNPLLGGLRWLQTPGTGVITYGGGLVEWPVAGEDLLILESNSGVNNPDREVCFNLTAVGTESQCGAT